jgi:hypothetical protein
MSNLGNAYALASALYARDKEAPIEAICDNLYHCVDGLGFGSEERKADLYAQLTERLTDGMPFEQVVEVIEAAMDSTDKEVARG